MRAAGVAEGAESGGMVGGVGVTGRSGGWYYLWESRKHAVKSVSLFHMLQAVN